MEQHPRWSGELLAVGLVTMLKCVLQHNKGVISMRFVHNKLGTPVCPNWDKMRLGCSEATLPKR